MKRRIIKFITIFLILLVLGGMGCSAKKTQNVESLLCNNTSQDDMAENETGFFYIHEKILYYADKENMTTWIPVCNKADCAHKGATCNAYVGTEIAQKDGNLYYISQDINDTVGIYQVSLDGSKAKKVYEIPLNVELMGFRGLISSSSLVLSYTYLTEDGMYKSNIDRLEEDGTLYHMYSEVNERQVDNLFMSGSPFFIRGDEVVLSSRLTLKYTTKTGLEVQNVLWRMNGNEPELVTLPDDVLVGWSYLSEDFLIDYEGRDGYEKGYYKYDLTSGEKILLGKSEQDNAWGYIMTEDCVVESNRYLNQSPDNAYLKIYYNGKWMDVPLPDVVTKLEKTSFCPMAIASDRIFFSQDIKGNDGYSCRLYYVMLNDETPELTYCTTFGSDSYFELDKEDSSNTVNTEWKDLDITVFDTEEYFIKVTGIGVDEEKKNENVYKITMYCENKTLDKDFTFNILDGTINGIYVTGPNTSLGAGFDLCAGESKEHIIYIPESYSEIYHFDEYTDIAFLINNYENTKNMQKIVHIYPQGEEHAISYQREKQSTDEVIIDNEYVRVTIVGYESNTIINDTVKIFIENKSDTNIAWQRDEIPVVNGIQMIQYEEIEDGLFILVSKGKKYVLFPNCCMYSSISLPNKLLEVNNINSIQSWEVVLKIWYGDVWDKELVNEIFTITP